MQKTIVSFGEALWDLLPTGAVLGGAPLNLAYRANAMGDHGIIATRLGQDDFGRRALQEITSLKMETRYIQWDEQRPTGTVQVTLDERGNPDYFIVPNVAYDSIEMSDDLLAIVRQCDCFCYGTLTQRSPITRRTLFELLEAATGAVRFLDINLRKDCFTRESVVDSLSKAQIVKLNAQELGVVCAMLDISHPTIEVSCDELMERFSLTHCLVTLGEAGVFAISSENETACVPGYKVVVVDTCGAGDALSAGFIHQFLRGRSLAECCATGNALGAMVAMQEGATKPITPAEAEAFIQRKHNRTHEPGLASPHL